MTQQDLYYLKVIKRRLEELKSTVIDGLPSIGSEALNDEINWLDCFIDQHERAKV